jgi:hypothetical protein
MASANAASGLSIVVFMDSRYAETRNPARRKYRIGVGNGHARMKSEERTEATRHCTRRSSAQSGSCHPPGNPPLSRA